MMIFRRLLCAIVAACLLSMPASALNLPSSADHVTAVAGIATTNKDAALVTSESLTTAGAGTYVLTLNSSAVGAQDSIVFASVANGTNTGGTPSIQTVQLGQKKAVVTVLNSSASTAFNGTIVVSLVIFK